MTNKLNSEGKMGNLEYTKSAEIKSNYTAKLLGISEEEHNKLEEAFREINNLDLEELKKHPLRYSHEGLQKMEEVYKTVIKIFSSINPKNKDIEKIKEFALTPIEEIQKREKESGSSVNYFRCGQASGIGERLQDLTRLNFINYLEERFIYVGKDHYSMIFYDPNSHGHIGIERIGCEEKLRATEEIDLEKIILEIEQTL